MIYHRDNKQGGRNKLLAILAIFFFLYLFTFSPIGSFTKHLVEKYTPFLWGVSNQLALTPSQMFSALYSKTSIIEENVTLKKEIRDMSLKLLDRNLLYEENLALKERLGRNGDGQTTIARVIAKPPRSFYDTLVIDVGSKQGITGGENVLYGDAIMIGEISEVSEKTSKVRLFSSSGENISVTIGKHSVPAVAVGLGGGNFEIKIPRDTHIALGDNILVPSLMPHFLGVVEYIESKESDPFERILFKSPISPLEIEIVEILIEESR